MLVPGNPPTPLASALPPPGWLKIDFHLHTREDPKDFLDHSALELLQRAHALGFHALAITLHDHVLTSPEVFAAARELGIMLIPAVELRVEGADIVIVNISPEEAQGLRSLDDVAAFRKRRGRSALIIAPHPFFVVGGSMGRRMLEQWIDLFDAIEICHFYTHGFNPNRPALRAATQFQKPLIATSDTHQLEYFGDHYSLVQATPDASPEMIFDAIRNGCIRPVSRPLSLAQFAHRFWWVFVEHEIRKFRGRRKLRDGGNIGL